MPMFRKKPAVIEAVQWDPDDRGVQRNAWPRDWPAASWNYYEGAYAPRQSNRLAIPTLEGTMLAAPGDWIIRGVKGEFYPCKPDIFAATYEPAEAAAPAPGEDGDLRERLAKAERSEHERWRMCDGSCDIALARRQVGPDGVVPGNAKECAELWEREASRLHSALLGSQRAEATAVERAHQADQRLTKAREALRELLDHCEEEVDGEQGEDTVCIMCGGGDPCAPDCPVGRARAALKSLEGA